MSVTLISRFASALVKKVEPREWLIHFVIAIAGIAWAVEQGSTSEKFLEIGVPLVWAVCAMGIVHCFSAARKLNHQIAEEHAQATRQRESPIRDSFGKPMMIPVTPETISRYKLKTMTIAVVLSATLMAIAFGAYRLAKPEEHLVLIEPTVSWNNPEPVLVGTALSDKQLNATSEIPGKFFYNPGLQFVLQSPIQYELYATFYPDDKNRYKTVVKSVRIVVNPAPQAPPQALKAPAPKLVINDSAMLRGELLPYSTTYTIDITFTVANEGQAEAKDVRVRAAATEITDPQNLRTILDTSPANGIYPGHSIDQNVKIKQEFKKGQVISADYVPNAMIVLILTYSGEHREELYFSCCEGRQLRALDSSQKAVLKPLIQKMFPR